MTTIPDLKALRADLVAWIVSIDPSFSGRENRTVEQKAASAAAVLISESERVLAAYEERGAEIEAVRGDHDAALERSRSLVAQLSTAKEEIERLKTLASRLQQEAEIHAGEARAHKASLHEAYQAVTGATGEPGNWNGAEPVKNFVSTARDRISALEEAIQEAFDLLLERKEHNPARSPGHNARLTLQAALHPNSERVDALTTQSKEA